METLTTGMAARFDTFGGLVPVRVQSIAGRSGRASSTAQNVTVRVTRTHGAYRAGEIIETSGLHVIPVRALRRRRYQTVIVPYCVACDAPA